MSINEWLFKKMWETQKKWKERELPLETIFLKEHRDHFALLGTALFGDVIKIKSTEKNGGSIGDSLYLPLHSSHFDNEKDNYRFYLYRIAMDLLAKKFGPTLKNGTLSLNDCTLLTLIYIPTLTKHLISEYPLLHDFVLKLNQRELKKMVVLNRQELSFISGWIEQLLGDTNGKNYSLLLPSQKNWINEIVTKRGLSAHDLINFGKIKKGELTRLGITIPSDFLLPTVWGNLPQSAEVLTLKSSGLGKLLQSEDEIKTTKKAKSKEGIKKINLDEKDPDCNPATLLMEAVKTAETYQGGKKMVDGSDELGEHFDALNELDMKEVTRSQTATQSVFKADITYESVMENAEEESSPIGDYSYDEWDYKSKKYKKEWCSLHEHRLPRHAPTTSPIDYLKEIKEKKKKEINDLRRRLERILLNRRWKKRQIDGQEIDIDALINAHADYKSGHTMSNRLYLSRRNSQSDVATLILLDSSLSSDSWVNGKRIMDISKDSIVILEEVLSGIFEKVAVGAFYSNTRKDCHYDLIKDFGEDWNQAIPKLMATEPRGYTRIGVALRHSFTMLNKVKAKKKVLLLLSDGKPTDYDAYEGKYGISDVRQAIREASAMDIDIFSLAIDSNAKFYFPQLFGTKNYQVLRTPEELPGQLIKLFSKLI